MRAIAHKPGRRSRTTPILAVLAACALALLLASPAGAASPPQMWQKCGAADPAIQCSLPRGIAANPANGHLYVADQLNRRIIEFTAWGAFVRTWGWDVIASGPGDDTVAPEDQFEICVPANGDVCKAGIQGSGVGQFQHAQGVAVDSAGDVYVVDYGNHRVQKFSPAGQFLLMFGGDVNQGGGTPANPGNLCTAAHIANGDLCAAATEGAGPGQFGDWAIGSFIAIDSSDKVYVGDEGRIQRFDTGGVYQGEIALPGETVQSLAVDPKTGNLFAAFETSNVHKLSPAGAELCTLEVDRPSAIAVDTAGSAYVFNGELFGSPSIPSELVQFDAGSCAEGEHFDIDSKVITASTGIAANTVTSDGDVALYVARLPAVAEPNPEGFIRAYSPTPDPAIVGPPPSVAPTIEAQYALSVDPKGALLRAAVNPHFWFDTSYYVQYGSEACLEDGWEAPCVSEYPTAPGVQLGAGVIDADIETAGVFLDGLTPDTAYRYRFVSESSGGGPVFGVGGTEASEGADGAFTTPPLAAPPKTDCPNQIFRTSASAFLPECRAFEMVSPVDKNGGGIETFFTLASGKVRAAHDQSAAMGDGITYSSKQAFGDAIGAPYSSQYLSRRDPDAGWSTHSLNAPHEGFPGGADTSSFDAEYKYFSDDLSEAWLRHEANPPLAPCAPLDSSVLYRRDNLSDTYEALHCEPNLLHLVVGLELLGVSGDGCRAVFSAKGKLTEDAEPGGTVASPSQLYESSCEGPLRLISVKPGGANCKEPSIAGSPSDFGNSDGRSKPLWNALSTDAHRIYWSCGKNLYLRTDPDLFVEGDEEVTQVAAPVSGTGSRFQSASPDGSRMLFITANPGGKGFRLQVYDASTQETTTIAKGLERAEGGRLDLLGASEDATRAYLASNEVLTEAPNSEGDKAIAGKPNLYLHTEGAGFDFIGTLSDLGEAFVNDDVQGSPDTLSSVHDLRFRRASRVSPDGLHAAFISNASLTGYDNTDANSGEADAEVFVYDAAANGGAGKTLCVSCNPSGARPSGRDIGVKNPSWAAAFIPGWQSQLYQGHPLSEDGQRLFFNSLDALVSRDTNSRQDVYEWRQASGKTQCTAIGAELYVASAGGCISLISSGQSPSDSEFVDADIDGSNVFIRTAESLLPQDPGLVDIYDVRIGGGFPQPVPPAGCEGESCQSPAPPPNDPTPASAAFKGAGNVTPVPSKRRCPKGNRRVARKGKTRCVKRQAKKHRHKRAANHDRRAQR